MCSFSENERMEVELFEGRLRLEKGKDGVLG